jgi:hypothetical protein
MSNPDSSVSSNLPAIGMLGGLIAILIVFLFTCKGKSYFNYLLYGGLPILIYLLASIINILAQHLSSKSINVGRAFLGGLPSIGAAYLSLLISYISYARIPIASAIAPMFLKTSVDVVANPIQKIVPTFTNTTKNVNTNQPGATPKQSLPPTIGRNSAFTNFVSTAKQTGGMLTKKAKKYMGGACCSPIVTLEDIENENPIIMGLSYGFYMFFAICFGGIFGTGIALA